MPFTIRDANSSESEFKVTVPELAKFPERVKSFPLFIVSDAEFSTVILFA